MCKAILFLLRRVVSSLGSKEDPVGAAAQALIDDFYQAEPHFDQEYDD